MKTLITITAVILLALTACQWPTKSTENTTSADSTSVQVDTTCVHSADTTCNDSTR